MEVVTNSVLNQLSGTAPYAPGRYGPCVSFGAAWATNSRGFTDGTSSTRSITPTIFIFGDFLTAGGVSPFEKIANYQEGFFGNDNAFKVRTYAGDDVLSGSGYFTYPNIGGSYAYSGAAGGGGRFYKNGRLFGSGTTASAGWPRALNRNLSFGGNDTPTFSGYVLYLFDRPLTDAQHAMLHADPFGLLNFGTDPAAAFYASAGAAPGAINRRLRTLMGVGR